MDSAAFMHLSVGERGEGRLHCTENLIYVFPEMKVHGLVPNFLIHLSVSDV
jgi:hypothetical protein